MFISFAKMQADVTEGVPTESIAHQIVRNKRGKRKGKSSELNYLSKIYHISS